MKTHRKRTLRFLTLVIVVLSLTFVSTRLKADTGTCGGATITLPFADVAAGNIFFCSIAEAFFSGLTNGTSATTYSPDDPVSRQQMAAFTTRTLDQSLKRGHPRAALGEWWTNTAQDRHFTITPRNPRFVACDGRTLWVSNTESNSVSRVDIRTGTLICTLAGVPSPQQIVIVSGQVFVASSQSPGRFYSTSIDVTTNTSMGIEGNVLGANPSSITYDGANMWTANFGTGPGTGSVSRAAIPNLGTTTFTSGFSQPLGILFDGANLWVTDAGDNTLKRVDINNGSVLQTIPLSGLIGNPIFDGTNLWVPCAGIAQLGVPDKVFVVRGVGGLAGTVLAELTGNGLNGPTQAAFDGERICVTNTAALTVSLWKATDLSPIVSVNLCSACSGVHPRGVCSDGIHFFVGMCDQSSSTGWISSL